MNFLALGGALGKKKKIGKMKKFSTRTMSKLFGH